MTCLCSFELQLRARSAFGCRECAGVSIVVDGVHATVKTRKSETTTCADQLLVRANQFILNGGICLSNGYNELFTFLYLRILRWGTIRILLRLEAFLNEKLHSISPQNYWRVPFSMVWFIERFSGVNRLLHQKSECFQDLGSYIPVLTHVQEI